MSDLKKLLEEIKEKLFDIRGYCYDVIRDMDKKIKQLEKMKRDKNG